MTNMLRETTIYPVTISLYNDYSTGFGYRLWVNDPETGYFREWYCGIDRKLALECYDTALAWALKCKSRDDYRRERATKCRNDADKL